MSPLSSLDDGSASVAVASDEEVLAPPDPELFQSLVRLASDPETRVIVCLGGGSVPGLCGNAALVKLLEELGLRRHVDTIWGTSAGAVIGGAWASGTEADDILASIRSLDGPGAVDVAWRELALAFLGRALGRKLPDALIRGRRFHEVIARGVRVQRIEDCEIPFRAISCSDDGSNCRKIFRDGPILPAISASMSLPGLLLARDEDGRPITGHYDGGMVERTPLISPISEHARSGDPRELLLLATSFSSEARQQDRARGFIERFLFTICGLKDQLWEYHLREARERTSGRLVVLTPRIDDPRLFDFARTEANYLQARRYFKDQLQNGKIGLTLGSR